MFYIEYRCLFDCSSCSDFTNCTQLYRGSALRKLLEMVSWSLSSPMVHKTISESLSGTTGPGKMVNCAANRNFEQTFKESYTYAAHYVLSCQHHVTMSVKRQAYSTLSNSLCNKVETQVFWPNNLFWKYKQPKCTLYNHLRGVCRVRTNSRVPQYWLLLQNNLILKLNTYSTRSPSVSWR